MDYYSILGVSKTASQDEIKRAYRKLAAQHHPDRGGDTKKFQDIQAAYDTLCDPELRQRYDMGGQSNFGGSRHPFGDAFDFGSMNFGDIFGQFGFRHTAPQIYNMVVFVTLEQIANGSSEAIHFNLPQGPKLVNIDIPKGIDDGAQVRYDGIIPNGLLLIQFRQKQHSIFTRRGLDLYMNKSINVFDMILGTKFTVVDIYGTTLTVDLPPKTKNGATFRLNGRGLSNNQAVGDQFLLIQAEIPDNISTQLQTAIIAEQKRTKI